MEGFALLQESPPSLTPGIGPSSGTSTILNSTSSFNQGAGQQLAPTIQRAIQELAGIGEGQDPTGQLAEWPRNLSMEGLPIENLSTRSDVGNSITPVTLPKRVVEMKIAPLLTTLLGSDTPVMLVATFDLVDRFSTGRPSMRRFLVHSTS